MPWKHPNFRTLLACMSVFVLGFALGAVLMAAVASRASRGYLSASQLMFRNAEEQHASEAWRAGDFEAAAGYTFCAVEAEHGAGAAQAFRQDAIPWAPFHLALLQAIIIEPNQPTFKKTQPMSEAAARAKLAVAWERLGRVDAANREYARSAALTGNTAVATWRSLGLQTIDLWSKVQDQRDAAPTPPKQP